MSEYLDQPEITTEQILSLDDDALRWRRQLVIMANHLAGAVRVGNPAPKVERMHERMVHPRIGDVVYEISSFWRRDADSWAKGFGILKRIADEPVWTYESLRAQYEGEEIDAETEAEIQLDLAKTETVYYVQYGPAAIDVCRWENAMFFTVPIGRRFFESKDDND